ncbi:hypothetical protein D3C85_571910 [compost metagenome]
MKPTDAEDPEDGGRDHPSCADAPGQQGDGADQEHAADDGDDRQRCIPGQGGAGKAQSRHAHEVHGGDAEPARQGGDHAARSAQVRQRQLHGDIEGDDDDGQGGDCFLDIISDRHADLVGLHGDEVGAPDSQTGHQRRGDQIDPTGAASDISGAIKQREGDQQAEYGYEQGEGQNSPIMLVNQAVQDRIHFTRPSKPPKRLPQIGEQTTLCARIFARPVAFLAATSLGPVAE